MNSFLKLWPYIRPYRATFIWILISGAVMSAAASFAVVLAKDLFNDGFSKSDPTVLVRICGGIIGIYFIHGIARYFHLYLLKYTSEKITVQIQKDLQSQYMRLSLKFHGDSDSGAHISRILNDVTAIQWGLNIFADIVREPILVFLLIGWIFYLDWKLSLMLFTVGPLLVILLRQIGKSVRKYSYTQQETLEKFTSTLKETLDGLRVIQSFGLEKEMRRRLQSVVDRYLLARRKIISRQESAGPYTEFIGACAFAAAAYYMGLQIIHGQAKIGDFISFIAALGYIQAPVKKLQDAYVRLQQTAVSTDRIFAILEEDQFIPEPAVPEKFPTNWDTIEFKNVGFAYRERPTLKNVNLTVRRGEVIALVGESGSGKSTLVNLLQRFYDPTEGEILIGGRSSQKISLKELRSQIALVTQDVFLFNDTIERNIQSGDFDNEVMTAEEAARKANAHDFIMHKPQGYQTLVGERGNQLSGGEKQRVSIARALYKNAPILILDEATSALDSASEVEVQKGLETLMKGRTTFVIAHRLSTVTKADRILVLHNGEIVEQGDHSSLVQRQGNYYQFFKLQTQM